MPRPCFLVVDREYSGSISTRKLVIETAKLNVITAYSGAEAVEMLRRFPAVDAVVLDAGMPDMSCAEIIGALKRVQAKTPVIAIGTSAEGRCSNADYILNSFEPAKLVEFLRTLLPAAEQVIQAEEQSHDWDDEQAN